MTDTDQIVADFPDLRLLTAAQTAELLSVSESHLCNMRSMRDGGGLAVTYVGSGRTPRYSVRAIREFIEHGGTPCKRVSGLF